LATPLGAGLGVLFRELEQSPAMEHFRELGPIFVQEGAGGKSYEGRAAKLRTIQESIENHRRVKLNYRKPSSETSQWAVFEPLAVYVRHQSTYIVVRGDGPIVFLKLDRIYGARRTDERFAPAPFDVRLHLADCIGIFHGEAVQTAKIRLSRLAGLVAEEEPLQAGQVVTWQSDEAVLEVHYRGDIELIRWVLGWGGQAEVLSPESLRARVIDELKKASKKYSE
jgi:predicted DNA-binding transcriptional regulator YafY